jgi:hypothetical protein
MAAQNAENASSRIFQKIITALATNRIYVKTAGTSFSPSAEPRVYGEEVKNCVTLYLSGM